MDRSVTVRPTWALSVILWAYFGPWVISAVLLKVVPWRAGALVYLPLLLAIPVVMAKLELDKWLEQWRGNPKWWWG